MLRGKYVCYWVDSVVVGRRDSVLAHRSIWCWETSIFVIALIRFSIGGMIVCWFVSPVGVRRQIWLLLCQSGCRWEE